MAHAQIEELVARTSLPDFFYYRGDGERYEIYPMKFMHETWCLLEERGLASSVSKKRGKVLTRSAGLCIMAILADACAGTTRNRVTDRAQAYASLAKLLGEADLEAPLLQEESRECLVSIALNVLDLDHLGLEQLVALRRKEASEHGHDLTDLRHRYLERIERHVNQLTQTSNLTPSDLEVLEREFEQDMKVDVEILKDQLKGEFKEALFSREILLTVLAGTVSLAGVLLAKPMALNGLLTWTGAPVSVGGVLGARNKFLKARAQILRNHPMAYLYESQQGLRL
jgi:hypothetical protein